jgi:AcrR family transcriptional regulator
MTTSPIRRLYAVGAPPDATDRSDATLTLGATSGSAPSPEPGLRERKKQLTRQSIAAAAFELALERGVDAITIDEIAARAVVSPRTVSNYFRSKEAAIVAADSGVPATLLAGLEERAPEEPPLVALAAVLSAAISALSEHTLATIRAKEELVQRFPALLPHRVAQFDALEEAIRGPIAARLGLDAETDAYPQLVAGAASSAVRTAIRVWLQHGGDADALAKIVAESLMEFDAGLPLEA